MYCSLDQLCNETERKYNIKNIEGGKVAPTAKFAGKTNTKVDKKHKEDFVKSSNSICLN